MEKDITALLVSDRTVENSEELSNSSQQSKSSIYHDTVKELCAADVMSDAVDSSIPVPKDVSISFKYLQQNNVPVEFSGTARCLQDAAGAVSVSESPNVWHFTEELAELYDSDIVDSLNANEKDHQITLMSTAAAGTDASKCMGEDSTDMFDDMYNSVLLVERSSDAEKISEQKNKNTAEFHDISITSESCNSDSSDRIRITSVSTSSDPSQCQRTVPEVIGNRLEMAESHSCLETVTPAEDGADNNVVGGTDHNMLRVEEGDDNCNVREKSDQVMRPACEEAFAIESVTSITPIEIDVAGNSAYEDINFASTTGEHSCELGENGDQVSELCCETILTADSVVPIDLVESYCTDSSPLKDRNLIASMGEHKFELCKHFGLELEPLCEEMPASDTVVAIAPVEKDDTDNSAFEDSNLMVNMGENHHDNCDHVLEPPDEELSSKSDEMVTAVEGYMAECAVDDSNLGGNTSVHNSNFQETHDQVLELHCEDEPMPVELVAPVEHEIKESESKDTDLEVSKSGQNCELKETSEKALEPYSEDMPIDATVLSVENDVVKETFNLAVSTSKNCEHAENMAQELQLHREGLFAATSERNTLETESSTAVGKQLGSRLPVVSDMKLAPSTSCVENMSLFSCSSTTSASKSEMSTVVTVTGLHSSTSTNSDKETTDCEPHTETDEGSSVIILKNSSTWLQSTVHGNVPVSITPLLSTIASSLNVAAVSAARISSDQRSVDVMPSISEPQSAIDATYRPAGALILSIGKNLVTEYVFKEIVKWTDSHNAEKEKFEKVKAAFERVASKNEVYHHKVGHKCRCGFFALSLRAMELHKLSGSTRHDNQHYFWCCYCTKDRPFTKGQFIHHLMSLHSVTPRLRLPVANQCPYCSYSSRQVDMWGHIKYCRARFMPQLNLTCHPGLYEIPLIYPVTKSKSSAKAANVMRLNNNRFAGNRVAVPNVANSAFASSAVLTGVQSAVSLGPLPVALFNGAPRPVSATSFAGANLLRCSTGPTFVRAQVPFVSSSAAVRIPTMNYLPVVPVGIITNRYAPLPSSSPPVLVQRPAIYSSCSTGNVLQNVGSLMPLNRPLGQLTGAVNMGRMPSAARYGTSISSACPIFVQKSSIYATSSFSDSMLNFLGNGAGYLRPADLRAADLRPADLRPADLRPAVWPRTPCHTSSVRPVNRLSNHQRNVSISAAGSHKKQACEARCPRSPVVVLRRLQISECEICGSVFSEPLHLLNHLQKAHEIEVKNSSHKPLPCFCCQQRFYSRPGVLRHMRIVHKVASNVHGCQRCSEIGIIDLVEHYRVKHNTPLHSIMEWRVCYFCRLNFATASEVEKHVISQHKDLFPSLEEFRQALHKSLQTRNAAMSVPQKLSAVSSNKDRVVHIVAEQPALGTNRKRRRSESVVRAESSDLHAAGSVKRRKCDNEASHGKRQQPPATDATLVLAASTNSTEVRTCKDMQSVTKKLHSSETKSSDASNSQSMVIKAGQFKKTLHSNHTSEFHSTPAFSKGSVHDAMSQWITKECVVSLSQTAEICHSSLNTDIKCSTLSLVAAQVKPSGHVDESSSQSSLQLKPSDPTVAKSRGRSGRYSCSVCSKNLDCWVSFQQHFKSLHGIDMQQCPQCGEPFPRGVLLVQHITQKHLVRCSVALRRIDAQTCKNAVPSRHTVASQHTVPSKTVSPLASTCSVSLARLSPC